MSGSFNAYGDDYENLGRTKEDVEELARKELEKKLADKLHKGAFFPTWKSPRFSWGLDPIVGVTYQNTSDAENNTSTINTELGGAGHIDGVGTSVNHGGLFLGLRAGKGWGSQIGTKNSDAYAATYAREFGSVSATMIYRFIKVRLVPRFGFKSFGADLEGSPSLRTEGVNVDTGLLVLPIFSIHHSFDYLKAYYSNSEAAFLAQKDHWLHARYFMDFMSFNFDVGPGITVVDQTNDAGVISGQTTYLKALAGAKIFGFIGFNGYLKYIAKSTESDLTGISVSLPSEGLYDESAAAQPEDSVVGSAFFGFRNIFAGIGFGYQYSYQAINFSEKDGKTKQSDQQNGFVFSYSLQK